MICKCGCDVKGFKFCPQCGERVVVKPQHQSHCVECGYNVTEVKFCPECGAKVEVIVLKPICSQCYADVTGKRFCAECGTATASPAPVTKSRPKSNLAHQFQCMSVNPVVEETYSYPTKSHDASKYEDLVRKVNKVSEKTRRQTLQTNSLERQKLLEKREAKRREEEQKEEERRARKAEKLAIAQAKLGSARQSYGVAGQYTAGPQSRR